MLLILTFRTPDEAVEKANSNDLRFFSGFWTDKGAKIFFRLAQCLRRASSGATPTTSLTRARRSAVTKERLRARGAGCQGLVW